jgi:hypothetical protein
VFFITGVALDMTAENARRRPAFEAPSARNSGMDTPPCPG